MAQESALPLSVQSSGVNLDSGGESAIASGPLYFAHMPWFVDLGRVSYVQAVDPEALGSSIGGLGPLLWPLEPCVAPL